MYDIYLYLLWNIRLDSVLHVHNSAYLKSTWPACYWNYECLFLNYICICEVSHVVTYNWFIQNKWPRFNIWKPQCSNKGALNAVKPLSHQTVIPQRLYSVLKTCHRAVWSPRNTPKHIKFASYSVYTTSSQRPYSVHTTFPLRRYGVHDASTARKQLLQCVHGALTARTQRAESVLTAHTQRSHGDHNV